MYVNTFPLISVSQRLYECILGAFTNWTLKNDLANINQHARARARAHTHTHTHTHIHTHQSSIVQEWDKVQMLIFRKLPKKQNTCIHFCSSSLSTHCGIKRQVGKYVFFLQGLLHILFSLYFIMHIAMGIWEAYY